MKKLKVLHGPINIGNHAWSLGQMERKVAPGLVESRVVDFFPTIYAQEVDESYSFGTSPASGIHRRLAMAVYASKALHRFDLFHFYFGKTFFPPTTRNTPLDYLDLPLLNRLGKKCVMTFQGCDARLRMATLSSNPISACDRQHCQNPQCDERLDRIKQKNISLILKHCAHVFCLNPDQLRHVPGAEFLPYCLCQQRGRSKREKRDDAPMVIVHAPTDRHVKGTKYVLEAFATLQKHYPVECIIVENMSHREALQVYEKADLVVDQLLCGWYGGLSVEVMQMGIPVVAYIRESDLPFIPEKMREELPVINANPDTITDVLVALVEDRERLRELGRRSKRFAHRWHNPEAIARAMIQLYQNPSGSFWANFDIPG
ncbi:hypothetical protein GTO91_07260 [Heliobacterium undosum]|uniref:Glycosyltransferase n=1 Tax=Heliomicrobium undosum TaxID=121734 RepID=A0A845L046_9FIRM|nr:glycosyltransferase [Heliomicrobium undosum]MZP29503.1 hypothetical protein [Heliomicrobium undosum]